MKLLKAETIKFKTFFFCVIEFTRKMSAHYNPKKWREGSRGQKGRRPDEGVREEKATTSSATEAHRRRDAGRRPAMARPGRAQESGSSRPLP
jgi:hypothetical protein